jgi:Molecular chaperone, HSP90 family
MCGMSVVRNRDDSYWQQPVASTSKDVKLMVKHVFITSDLGDGGLPKWASWVKVVVDGALTTPGSSLGIHLTFVIQPTTYL